jgi:hypothetical protein
MTSNRRQRKSKIQSHFQFKGLRTLYHQPVRSDETSRIYTVTDMKGNTKKATSNEFFVAQALTEQKLEFEFQMSIAGGRGMAFGIVLDFLVMTMPQPTPVWVHGEHWHQGAKRAKDLADMQRVEAYGQGAYAKGVEIWGNESSTIELARLAVRMKII